MALIKKKTIKEQTYEYLKNKILSGEINPGEKINIEELAKELEISNSPIREAINLLNKEGLVQTQTNHSIRVIEFNEDGILDLTDAIEMLIIGGFKICLRKSKINELVLKMETCLKEQEEYFKIKDNRKFLEQSIKFDEIIVKVSGNAKLITMVNNLNDLFLLVVKDYQTSDKSRELSLNQHNRILEAVRNKDMEEFQKALFEHFDHSRQMIKENKA
ncbi:GntR family transcriptional regulator [Clostridium sp. DL1XJH146]